MRVATYLGAAKGEGAFDGRSERVLRSERDMVEVLRIGEFGFVTVSRLLHLLAGRVAIADARAPFSPFSLHLRNSLAPVISPYNRVKILT